MGATASTIRCSRCWATYKQVSIWRFFGVGVIKPDLVCCIDPMGERVTL